MWKLGFAAPRQGAPTSGERGLKQTLPWESSRFAGLLGMATAATISHMDSPAQPSLQRPAAPADVCTAVSGGTLSSSRPAKRLPSS